MFWSTVDSRRPTAGSRLVLPLPLAMAQAKDGTGAPPTIRTHTENNPQIKEFIWIFYPIFQYFKIEKKTPFKNAIFTYNHK